MWLSCGVCRRFLVADDTSSVSLAVCLMAASRPANAKFEVVQRKSMWHGENSFVQPPSWLTKGSSSTKDCYQGQFFFFFLSLIQRDFERRTVAKWARRGISLIIMAQHIVDSQFCPKIPPKTNKKEKHLCNFLNEGRGSKLSQMMGAGLH